jgi:DNA replication licensing factor MCM6
MAAAQPVYMTYVPDPAVEGLAESFAAFLADFSPEDWQPEPSQQATQGSQDGAAGARSFMARNVAQMCYAGETVLYVQFEHLQAFNYDMSNQIRDHYERAEPVMRRALQDYVRDAHPDFLKEAHGVEKEFFVGVTGLPDTERLRDLRVEKIGRLVSFSGTVTRTSEVRPELFLGAFKCARCMARVTGVEQQYKYTTPLMCKAGSCGNK